MNKTNIHIAALLATVSVAPAAAQQVLATDNALAGCKMEIEGAQMPVTAENLFDGDDTTIFHLDNATEASMIFTLRQPWYVQGVNLVAGDNLEMAPAKVSIYGLDEEAGTWKAITRTNTAVSIQTPYRRSSPGIIHRQGL